MCFAGKWNCCRKFVDLFSKLDEYGTLQGRKRLGVKEGLRTFGMRESCGDSGLGMSDENGVFEDMVGE
jgi:hypothetical protein